jgi:hypothetical protein
MVTLGLGYWYWKKSSPLSSQSNPISDDDVQKRQYTKIREIEKFIENNPKYNEAIVFLADLKIMSGKN